MPTRGNLLNQGRRKATNMQICMHIMLFCYAKMHKHAIHGLNMIQCVSPQACKITLLLLSFMVTLEQLEPKFTCFGWLPFGALLTWPMPMPGCGEFRSTHLGTKEQNCLHHFRRGGYVCMCVYVWAHVLHAAHSCPVQRSL